MRVVYSVVDLFLFISITTALMGCYACPRTQHAVLTSDSSGSKLIFQSSFEKSQHGWNAWEGGDWNGVEAANATSITRTNERARNGKYSAKFIINKSETSMPGGKPRAELTDWDGRMIKVRSERWYGLSIFLPESYKIDPCEEQLFQWHGVNKVDLDGSNMANSPLAMYTINGRWEFGLKFGGKFDLGEYQKNVWTDWVLHIKFSPGDDGVVEIWKNGQKVLERNGKNTYNDKVGNYFKIGIYKYGWADNYFSSTSSRTIFYDDIKVGNETSSYIEVAPKM